MKCPSCGTDMKQEKVTMSVTVLLPYRSISELPIQFDKLPTGAKEIAMNVVNSVLKGGGSEESAFKQAWGAVKQSYEKVGDDWKRKS